MGELVVAVDIGTSKICALCGQINKAGLVETLAKATVPCTGMKKGMIVDIDNVARAIMNALRQVEAAGGARIGSAYINVMGLHVDVFTNRASTAVTGENREISKNDVDRLLYSVRNVEIPGDAQIIDVIPRQFNIDGYNGITEPIGMIGTNVELEADIVTGKITSITNIIKCIESAGIKIDGLVISGQALSEVILSPEEMDMGVIMLDIGGSVTDVSVFKGGRLCFYESLTVGGDHITNDISIGMKIPYADAERTKKEYDLALTTLIRKDQELYLNDINNNTRKLVYISEVVEIIEARVYEIMSMCRDLLNENRIEFDFGAGVVLTGGGISYFDGNRQIANAVFGLPVRVFPERNYKSQRIESTLAEGVVKHVARMGKGTRYGSDVQLAKSREPGTGTNVFVKIIEMIKKLF
ncbi:MAG: cell division protein FtsA [Oscillospiraceae bacterium]|nr:cell division protein FtsA [Oscillospiraceae bacterium]